MQQIKNCSNLKINSYGTIGSLMNGYLNSYLSVDEIEIINEKIDILNKKLQEFDIFQYKIINRYKIKNLIVKALSEESDYFIEIAVNILNMSEDNFENITGKKLPAKYEKTVNKLKNGIITFFAEKYSIALWTPFVDPFIS